MNIEKPIIKQEIIAWIRRYNALVKNTWLFRTKTIAAAIEKDELSRHPLFGNILGWANKDNVISFKLLKILKTLQLPQCYANTFDCAENTVSLLKHNKIEYHNVLYDSEKTYKFEHMIDSDEFGSDASTVRIDVINRYDTKIVIPSTYVHVLNPSNLTNVLCDAAYAHKDYTALYDFDIDDQHLIKHTSLRKSESMLETNLSEIRNNLGRPDIYNTFIELISEVGISNDILNKVVGFSGAQITKQRGLSKSQFVFTLGYCNLKHTEPTKEELGIADFFEFTTVEQVYMHLQNIEVCADVALPNFDYL